MSATAVKVLSVPLAGIAATVGVGLALSYTSPLRPRLYAGAWHEMPVRAVSWMRAPPRDVRVRLLGGGILVVSALAGLGTAGTLGYVFVRGGGARAQLRPSTGGGTVPEPVRARSKLHGDADFMTEAQMARTAGERHPAWGNTVYGLAWRPDLNPRRDPATAPLLRDPCTREATHGEAFFPPGSGKTSSITGPNLHPDEGWRGNVFVNDPSTQAGPLFAGWRREMGQRVAFIGPQPEPHQVAPLREAGIARVGSDIFAGINPAAAGFEQAVFNAVASMGRELDPAAMSGQNSVFVAQGRALQRCLLADLLSDPATPPAERTPEGLLDRLMVDMRELRGRLEDVKQGSVNRMARRLAANLMKQPEKTFGGFMVEASADLEWLLVPENAAIVSGVAPGSITAADFVHGDLAVFLQLGVKRMEDTPGVGRSILNALLDGIFAADGRTDRAYLLLNDERVLFGKLRALSTVGSQGRKYRVTCINMWQSPAQQIGLLNAEEARVWKMYSAWQAYSSVDDETAEMLSGRLGTYTALAPSEGTNSTSSTGAGSGSRGTNSGVTLVARPLMTPAEIEAKVRGSRQIVLRRTGDGEDDMSPMLCGKAYYFQRPEMREGVGQDPYRVAAE